MCVVSCVELLSWAAVRVRAASSPRALRARAARLASSWTRNGSCARSCLWLVGCLPFWSVLVALLAPAARPMTPGARVLRVRLGSAGPVRLFASAVVVLGGGGGCIGWDHCGAASTTSCASLACWVSLSLSLSLSLALSCVHRSKPNTLNLICGLGFRV